MLEYSGYLGMTKTGLCYLKTHLNVERRNRNCERALSILVYCSFYYTILHFIEIKVGI